MSDTPEASSGAGSMTERILGLLAAVAAAALAWWVWTDLRGVIRPYLPGELRGFLYEFRLLLDLLAVFLVLSLLQTLWSKGQAWWRNRAEVNTTTGDRSS